MGKMILKLRTVVSEDSKKWRTYLNADAKSLKKHKFSKDILITRPMRASDVISYFRNITPKGKALGQYCERCGIMIGKNHNTKKANNWGRYLVCDGCYKDKITRQQETTPDLEDIRRYRIEDRDIEEANIIDNE